MVISKDLAGPLGLFVNFSALQEYGVDKVFLLENENIDSSQRNVVFLVHAEKPSRVKSTAGMYVQSPSFPIILRSLSLVWYAFACGRLSTGTS